MIIQVTCIFIILAVQSSRLIPTKNQLPEVHLINDIYKIETLVKKGGCGSVYKGRDISNQKQVAIKGKDLDKISISFTLNWLRTHTFAHRGRIHDDFIQTSRVQPLGKLGCQKKQNRARNTTLWSFCSTFK